MKITKHAIKKINLIASNHPKILQLYPDEESFRQDVITHISGYAQQYGVSKVLNLYVKAVIAIDSHVHFDSREHYNSVICQKLASEVYNAFEKKDDSINFIQTYFDEVGKIYEQNNNFKEEIEFLPENREQFIKSNLKLVISTAKRYMNMGIPFEDLIGAGNVGLCEAFNKFKMQRNTIRENILEIISNVPDQPWTKSEVRIILSKQYTYGDILEKLVKKIPEDGFVCSEDFKQWVKKYIKSAVFASVAFMWIRAYIMIEISKNSYIIKLPKEATEDMAAKTHFISIAEYNMQDDNPDFDVASDDYERNSEELDQGFKNEYFKNVVEKLLVYLTPRERRIVIKRFGIGLPWSLRISEIAEDEDISPSRCTVTFRSAMQKIQDCMTEEEKQEIIHYLHFD